MRTVMELARDLLAKEGATLVMSDASARPLTRLERHAPGADQVDQGCVYLLLDEGNMDIIPDGPGSYVIREGHAVVRGHGDQSVLAVPEALDTSTVESTLRACCDATKVLADSSFEVMEALSGSRPARELCRTFSHLLGNPMAVTDDTFRIVASANETGARDASWDAFTNTDVARSPERWPEEWRGLQNDRTSYSAVPLVDASDANATDGNSPEGRTWMRGSLETASHQLFFLLTIDASRPFAPRDTPLLMMACDLLRGVMRPGAISRGSAGEQRLLSALLEGRVEDRGYASRVLRDLGVRLGRYSRVALLYHEGTTSEYTTVLRVAGRARHELGATTVVRDLEVAAILSLDDAGKEPLLGLEGFVRKLGGGWHAAVSFPFNAASSLHQALSQCEVARRIGSRAVPDAALHRYAPYAVIDLVETTGRNHDLGRFATPLAERIVSYDQQNGTEYARTVYCYLRCLGQSDLAADTLHVHRNTVLYRMGRARELFGLDMRDVGLVRALTLAFDVLAATRPELELMR